jgi:hypothetical protein
MEITEEKAVNFFLNPSLFGGARHWGYCPHNWASSNKEKLLKATLFSFSYIKDDDIVP